MLIPVWIFITGVSRIVMGAHFFSDVLWGFTLSYLLLALSCYLVRKRMPDIKENE
ncbi:MAG: phosphatase PAP2 family protein [Erysipelotrichaceae bacterium]|nr:phosphatase PAP2 family protein [Erysipelotrichaceae bacterium]